MPAPNEERPSALHQSRTGSVRSIPSIFVVLSAPHVGKAKRGSSTSCADWPAMLKAPQDCMSYLGSSISDWPHAGASTMASLVTSGWSCPRKSRRRTELRAARHRYTVNSPPCPNMLACKIRRPSRASVPTPHLFQDQPLRDRGSSLSATLPRATCHMPHATPLRGAITAVRPLPCHYYLAHPKP